MTDRNHDEIARRLRDTGTVPAPDRLRDEVMSQVRADPRARRRRPRRSFLVPVLPYAAAAAALAVVVLAFSHLGGGGSSSSSGGAGASAGGAERSSTAGDKVVPSASGAVNGGTVFHLSPLDARAFSDSQGIETRSPRPRTVVVLVPASRYAAFKKRLRRLEQHTQGDGSIRVILKPAS
jgi:hypothetical protein